jgi:hypothetical protein
VGLSDPRFGMWVAGDNRTEHAREGDGQQRWTRTMVEEEGGEIRWMM